MHNGPAHEITYVCTWNYLGMMSIICSTISMCVLKYIASFITALVT
jgi:hypothetical protein